MCEENPPVRFCAFTADDVGRVTSCQGADGDRVLARCVDGVDGKNQVVAANAVGMITSSIPCASLRPKVSLKILQYGEAVFIHAVAAVRLRATYFAKECPKLIALGKNLELKVRGLARNSLQARDTVTVSTQEVIPLQLKSDQLSTRIPEESSQVRIVGAEQFRHSGNEADEPPYCSFQLRTRLGQPINARRPNPIEYFP